MKNPSIDKSEITNVEGKPSLIYKSMPPPFVFLYNLYRVAGWNRAKGKKESTFVSEIIRASLFLLILSKRAKLVTRRI